MRQLLLIFVYFLGFVLPTSAQTAIITAFAGTGLPGFSGDGGPAATAQLYPSTRICSDFLGNVYITDSCRIRKVTPAGIVSTIAGTGTLGFSGDGGPAITAQLNAYRCDVVADNAGNLYVADSGVRIRKINAAGIITTIAGINGGGSGYDGDGGPATAANIEVFYLAIDAAGNLFFSDLDHAVIRKISTSGIISTVAGNGIFGFSGDGGPATAAALYDPSGLAVDATGNMYFVDHGNARIRKIDPAGNISTIAGNGIPAVTGDGGAATAAGISFCWGLTIDAGGNLFFTDNCSIRKIDASGIIHTIAGTSASCSSLGDGGAALSATINGPRDLATDNTGRVYVTEITRVREISGNHIPYFSAGNTQTKAVCSPAVLDTVLAIVDSETVQPLTWSFTSGPHHGTLSAGSYSGATSGGMVMPAGVLYTPVVGYRGLDTIVATISDGVNTGTSTIYLTVGIPLPGTIAGADTICVGDTTTLHNAAPPGAWSASNTKATISTSGFVTAMTTGRDTIRYIVSNACGSDTATLYLTVRPAGTCITAIQETYTTTSKLTLQPNPSHGSCTFNLSSPDDEAIIITITNILGQKVKELDWRTNRELELQTDLSPGIYMLSVASDSERLIVRVVVE